MNLLCQNGLSVESDEAETQMLVVAADADKKAIQQWLNDEKPSKEAVALIKTAQEMQSPKATAKETESAGKGCAKIISTFALLVQSWH